MTVDLVLINPGAAHGIVGGHPIYGDLGDDLIAVEPPLWVRLIGGYVRDRGYSIAIIDAEAERLGAEDVRDRVLELEPRLVALVVFGHQPSASTQQMAGARAIAMALPSEFTTIIVGGHVSALPQRTMDEEFVDFACKGEGPETIVQLLGLDRNLIDDPESLRVIPGLVWRDRDSVKVNPPAPLIDMPMLHGAVWDLLPMDRYRSHNWQRFGSLDQRQPYASVMTSLGCPYRCLAADTTIHTAYGPRLIGDLVDQGVKEIKVCSFDLETGYRQLANARNIQRYGENERLVRVRFGDGTYIDCTPDHEFQESEHQDGVTRARSASDLKIGSHVRAWCNDLQSAGEPIEGGYGWREGRWRITGAFSQVVSVEPLPGLHDVYCLEVPETGWFYANNVLVKNCSFCCINSPFDARRYRMRDPIDVVKEIATLYEMYGVRTFKITDEMFVLNHRHVEAICDLLIDGHFPEDFNLWAYARVDTVKAGLLPKMYAAGFRWLALGIESGSALVRDGAEKALRQDDIVGVVRQVQAAGINVIGNFMFGLRDDTEATMHQTLDLALECLPEFANFYSTMAYPGSPLYEQALAEGWALPTSWAGYSQHNALCRPLDTLHVDAVTVLRFRDAAFTAYFTDPRYLALVERKFGAEAVEHVRAMTTYHLPRELLGG